MVLFQATSPEMEESLIFGTGPRMLRSEDEHTKQNNNNDGTINHGDIDILSCAIEYEKVDQMVKMFRTHRCCAFDFDRKCWDARVNEIQIEAKKRGCSAPPASSSLVM
jgi:hypothetical protein